MKKFLLPLIMFILGIALGGVVMWFKFVIPAGRGSQMIYSDSIGSQADIALELRFGGEETFLKNFQSNLPAYVQALHYFETLNYNQTPDDSARRAILQALRKIYDYYAATGTPMPPDVAATLNALSPQPATAEDLAKSKSTLTKVGDISPIFSVPTINGQALDLHDKVVVLNFFATWCGPCMDEMPSLEKGIWDEFKNKGLVLASIGQGHSQSELERFQRQNSYTFPLVADPSREIYHQFATGYIPRAVVIGKDGRIKFQSVGYTPQDFAALVNAVKTELGK